MEGLRLDKWLWYARFVKSRSLAQSLIADGTVTVNGCAVTKPSTTVKPGDHLRFILRERTRFVVIRTLSDRRGPASDAVTMYEEEAGTVLHRDGKLC